MHQAIETQRLCRTRLPRLISLVAHAVGCDGLTQRRMGARLSITILLTSVVSVLTHPAVHGFLLMKMGSMTLSIP
jgi:hypothetical protein